MRRDRHETRNGRTTRDDFDRHWRHPNSHGGTSHYRASYIFDSKNIIFTNTKCNPPRTNFKKSVHSFYKGIESADISQHLGPAPTSAGAEYKAREDGSTMKALAWFGTTDVRVIDAPIPDITEPNDVILQVTGSTICGSDLHLYHGEIMALQKGDILGHEVSPTFNDRLIPHSRTTTL